LPIANTLAYCRIRILQFNNIFIVKATGHNRTKIQLKMIIHTYFKNFLKKILRGFANTCILAKSKLLLHPPPLHFILFLPSPFFHTIPCLPLSQTPLSLLSLSFLPYLFSLTFSLSKHAFSRLSLFLTAFLSFSPLSL